MISNAIFGRSLRSYYKLIVIFFAVLTLYMAVIVNMYDPDNDIFQKIAELKFSTEMLSAMGFVVGESSLAGVLASYFYGLLMLAFPMICYIIIGNKLIAGLVDKGSMACILSAPVKRKKIALTQAIFLLAVVSAIVAFVTVLGIILCEISFPGMLDINDFIKINIGVLFLHYAISGICFFASCVFNESKNSLMLGAGLPIVFLLILMLSRAATDFPVLKYLTVFSLYDPTAIIQGESMIMSSIVLILAAAALYIGGIMIFDKKDMPV